MAKMIQTANHIDKQKVKRPGVIAKTKTSNSKTSKHYKKAYRGQGRA